MAYRLEKLEKIRSIIDEKSEKDAEKIISDAEEKAEEMLSEEKKRIERERNSSFSEKLSRFESEERRRVSESRFAAERKVLLYRNGLVDKLFSEIEAELKKFRASGEYRGYILRAVEEADEAEKITEGVILYCGSGDKELVSELMKAYPVKIEADERISIGGIILKYPHKGTYIDLTFDTKLSEEREKFSATAEMQL